MASMILSNTLGYRSELCSGCGLCAVVCPHEVFAVSEGPAVLVHPERCMECGACRLNCPAGAISVESGVGCAAALIKAALTGGKETCGGGDNSCCGGSASCC
jgi:NAD-dependent dihydropyrimidine dehydrogenase PreA subunit